MLESQASERRVRRHCIVLLQRGTFSGRHWIYERDMHLDVWRFN
jgi:hypothetical protein